MPKRFSARLGAKQLSPQVLSLSPTVRQLRNQRNQNPPLRKLDRQLSNPVQVIRQKKTPKKGIFHIKEDNEGDKKTMKALKTYLRPQ